MDAAQQALLLLAVDPRLRGVAIAAPAGSGKSSLARGAQPLLNQGGAPFVELPIGADEEGLLGGLDIQATLRAGARVLRPGLLARADGGTVYVDGLNLLPDGSANLLLSTLESGVVQIERESMSLRAPARFCLLGSYDPAEGPPRRHLLDRLGLLIALPRAADALQRAEVVRRNLVYGQSREPRTKNQKGARQDRFSVLGSRFSAEWDDELTLLQGLVLAAREQLPSVRIDDTQIEQLSGFALACGVEGHRADAFAVQAACAAAALALRDAVEHEDLELAVRLVILPRATRVPAPAEPPDAPPPDAPPPPERQEQPPDDADDAQPPTPDPQLMEEQVLTALATELPADLAQLPFRALRRGRSGSRGTTNGRRGRHIRSSSGDPRRARIDIAATLRAAAPWQRLRTENQEPRTAIGSDGVGSQFSVLGSERALLQLRADDLRVKHFRSKAGALFCFAVDASGSMALHRMRQAKGAVHALLQQAYIHRDRVALLAFRGQAAELLLPPSQSVELARRALDLLPTGGGTPLAAALLRAIDVAAQARGRGILQTVLVLLTDGRANVGLRAERDGVAAELQHLGRQVAEAGIQAIVVDTQRSYLSRGEAQKLAGWLGGRYIYLPNAQGEQIAALALDARDG
jgi:magnesium chelatase subunit D